MAELLDASVGRVTLTIECFETTSRPFLAKGCGGVPLAVLPQSIRGDEEAAQNRVVLNVSTVHDVEFFLLDSVVTPFEVCISPSRFHPSMQTPLLSVHWIVRWRFWCVEAASSVSARQGSPASCVQKLKELYQELELPLTILPGLDSSNLRMGPMSFAT
jgi:hypothetical protein